MIIKYKRGTSGAAGNDPKRAGKPVLQDFSEDS
jgi:hypothetical protein